MNFNPPGTINRNRRRAAVVASTVAKSRARFARGTCCVWVGQVGFAISCCVSVSMPWLEVKSRSLCLCLSSVTLLGPRFWAILQFCCVPPFLFWVWLLFLVSCFPPLSCHDSDLMSGVVWTSLWRAWIHGLSSFPFLHMAFATGLLRAIRVGGPLSVVDFGGHFGWSTSSPSSVGLWTRVLSTRSTGPAMISRYDHVFEVCSGAF